MIRPAVADDSIGVWWTRSPRSTRVSTMPARVTGRSLIAAEDTTPRGRTNRDLRLCATSDRLDDVIDNLATTEEDRQRSAAVARALGDPKRLCVLESLAGGEASVGELAGRVACQVPNMSQHLSVLRSAGLVTARRDGSTVYYRLSDPRILEATQLLQSLAR